MTSMFTMSPSCGAATRPRTRSRTGPGTGTDPAAPASRVPTGSPGHAELSCSGRQPQPRLASYAPAPAAHLQRPVVRDTVAHHLIHRGAHGLGELACGGARAGAVGGALCQGVVSASGQQRVASRRQLVVCARRGWRTVVERRGVGPVFNYHGVHRFVNLVCGDARPDLHRHPARLEPAAWRQQRRLRARQFRRT